jgi:predicted PurR-regulated permease PerM
MAGINIEKFFEYGVGVGMFMVSVALLIIVFRYFTKSNEKISDNFTKSIESIDQRHKEERQLWQKAEDRRQESTNQVVLRIDQTIRECLSDKTVSNNLQKVKKIDNLQV